MSKKSEKAIPTDAAEQIRELESQIRELKSRKKYGLVWDDEGQREDVVKKCLQELPVLKEMDSKAISDDPSKPVNLLIEGDNYHALSVLNYTHEEKIDVIYIDPPYNTGKNDFTYNDKYIDANDGYRHSKWLNMMNERLLLARNLLSEHGVIVISIDDNEQANLALLCNEIFGEKNFIANFVWNSTKSVTNTALVSVSHNFNLCYAKDKEVFDLNFRKNFKLPAITTGFSNPDNDPRGKWKADPFEAGGVRKNQMYEIVNPNNGKSFYPKKGNCWKNDYQRYLELLKDNRIVFGKSGEGRPQRKRFIWEAESRGLTPNTWWSDVGTTTSGTTELRRILGDDVRFTNPKPVSLIKKILMIASQKNSIVLDFFAGSGTTGHAVLQLNKDDGGNRRFILCTNNEGNIATEICYPRIKKVIRGYKFTGKEQTLLYTKEVKNYTALKNLDLGELERIKKENEEKFDGISIKFDNGVLAASGEKNIKVRKEGLGGNLKYFKTEFVPGSKGDRLKRNLTDKAGDMLCVKEDTHEKVRCGRDYKIYRNGERCTGIIYHPSAISDFKKIIADIDGKFTVYIFSLSGLPYSKQFADMSGKVTLKAIPKVILSVYQRIFRKKG